MDKGREFELRMGLEGIREAAPELVPGFEAMLELSSFLRPPRDIIMPDNIRLPLRAEGFYWIRERGPGRKSQVARFTTRFGTARGFDAGYWLLAGCEECVPEEDIEWIGPKVEPPDDPPPR